MNNAVPRWRTLTFSLLGIAVGAAALVRSADLVQQHASLIQQVSQDALPIAAQIPALEERRDLLRRQLDVSTMASSTKLGRLREEFRAFALPSRPVDRVIPAITAVTEDMRVHGELRDMAPIEVGERTASSIEASGSVLMEQPLTLTVTVTDEGLRTLTKLFDLSGLITVADAMTPQQVQELLLDTERENPTGIVALGQFFSVDLAKYLLDPGTYDRRLLGEFSSTAFAAAFANVTQSSFFEDEGGFLRSGAGQSLLLQKLWPLPFMNVRATSVEDLGDGWERVTFTIATYGQGDGELP